MLAAVAWARKGAPALEPTTSEPIDEADEEYAKSHPAAPPSSRLTGARPPLHRPEDQQGSKSERAAAGQRGKRRAEEDDDSDSDDDDVPMAFVRENLAYYKSNKDDPNLTLKDEARARSRRPVADARQRHACPFALLAGRRRLGGRGLHDPVDRPDAAGRALG